MGAFAFCAVKQSWMTKETPWQLHQDLAVNRAFVQAIERCIYC